MAAPTNLPSMFKRMEKPVLRGINISSVYLLIAHPQMIFHKRMIPHACKPDGMPCALT